MKEFPLHRLKFENEYWYIIFSNREDREWFHILVAEDDIGIQALTARILKREGYSVEVANNGKEAIDALNKQHFDLVLMDVQMPEIDGIEAAQLIRKSKNSGINPDIPIISVTVLSSEEYMQQCRKAGMNGFITKPFEEEKFFRKIIRLVQVGVLPFRYLKTRHSDNNGNEQV